MSTQWQPVYHYNRKKGLNVIKFFTYFISLSFAFMIIEQEWTAVQSYASEKGEYHYKEDFLRICNGNQMAIWQKIRNRKNTANTYCKGN